jgi:hypothetical protein
MRGTRPSLGWLAIAQILSLGGLVTSLPFAFSQ